MIMDKKAHQTLQRIKLYYDDIPEDFPREEKILAIDTEAMGLCPGRDRLCLVQLSWGDGKCYLVKIDRDVKPAPNLVKLLNDSSVEKLFHFGRFDIGILYRTFNVLCNPVYCTKMASRLSRTYTDRHGLKELCRELLKVDISKAERTSDWGSPDLTDAQKAYASADVLYLHDLRERFNYMLKREERFELFKLVCNFLPHQVLLDHAGFTDSIFDY
jgi:ribonuclease D